MLAFRVLLCFLFPPFAIADKGCGTSLIVIFMTFACWPIAVIIAFTVCMSEEIKGFLDESRACNVK